MFKVIAPPPLRISVGNCLAWYDAAETKTIVSSSNRVSTWRDKSGNNNHATQALSGIYGPYTNTIQLNGLNALSFDAANTYLDVPAIIPNLLSGEFTIFSVAKANGVPASSRYLFGSSTAQRVFQTINTSGNISATFGASALTLDTTQAATSAFAMYSQHLGSGDVCAVKGNASSVVSSVRSYTGTPANLSIGCLNRSPSSSQTWDGVIAEIIIYNKYLSSTQINYIMNYLEKKWNIV